MQSEARNNDRNLYNNNKEVYKLLRYGKEVTASASEKYQRVHFINWNEPEKNNFAIAEEVTILGNREKRPDIVLYVKSHPELLEKVRECLGNSGFSRENPLKIRVN